MNSVLAKQQPVMMYHGTSSEFLRSILKNGLAPAAAKKGRWTEEEEKTSEIQRSRKSYGGIYFTPNYGTATSSATNTIIHLHPGGWQNRPKHINPLIVIVQLQPEAVLPDEDNYLSDIKRVAGIPEYQYRHILIFRRLGIKPYGDWIPLFDKWRKGVVEFIETYDSNFSKRKDQAKLFRLAEEVLLTEIERVLAYKSTRAGTERYWSVERDIQKDLGYIKLPVPYKYGDPLPRALRLPSKAEAENRARQALDLFTKKTRGSIKHLRTDERSYKSVRSLEPVGFKGTNRILCIVEIVDKRGESGATLVVHYGKPPPKFIHAFETFTGTIKDVITPAEYKKLQMQQEQAQHKIAARAVTAMAKLTPKTAKPAGMPTDNYCSIASLALVLNKSMPAVWDAIKPYWGANTREGHGMSGVNLIRVLDHAFKKRAVELKKLRDHPLSLVMPYLGRQKGSFLVIVARHVIGVKDGSFVDTNDSPPETIVVGVLQVRADTRIGKCVMFEHEQNGKTLALMGIYYGDGQVYVSAVNGEGLLSPKKMWAYPKPTPPELKKKYDDYVARHKVPYNAKKTTVAAAGKPTFVKNPDNDKLLALVGKHEHMRGFISKSYVVFWPADQASFEQAYAALPKRGPVSALGVRMTNGKPTLYFDPTLFDGVYYTQHPAVKQLKADRRIVDPLGVTAKSKISALASMVFA